VLEYLLDTNTCIRFLNGSSRSVAVRMAEADPASLALSSIVKAELLFGARRSAREQANLALLERFFEPFASLPFDDRCADEYGRLRSELEGVGRPIGPNDLLIAATARAYELTLVSNNTREFGRIARLRVEDWERS
jgi:tRNA(fMet)-specific endonuclease VapC